MQLAARTAVGVKPVSATRGVAARPSLRSHGAALPRQLVSKLAATAADIADAEDEDISFEAPSSSMTLLPGEKVKLRVRMRGYDIRLLESACQQVADIAQLTGAKAAGPVRLPTKKKVYCVLRSPHVNKDAREHFEIRTHHRLVDVSNLSAQTVQALLEWVPPSGLEVESSIV